MSLKEEVNELIGSPVEEISTKISKFDNYDIINGIENDLFIVASSKAKTGLFRDVAENIRGNYYHVFIDLINMYSHLSFSNTIIRKRTEIDKLINDSDKEIILRFCKKNGLPYWGNTGSEYSPNPIQNNDHSDNSNFSDYVSVLKDKYPYKFCYAYCNLSYFLYHTYHLYDDFIKYLKLYNPQMIETFERNNIDISNHKKGEKFYPIITTMITFESRLEERNNRFYFEVTTQNIFCSSVYYFSLICTSKYIELDKLLKIKTCSCCGQRFITSRKGKKYCDYCSPQKAWNKKNRKSKEIS